MELKILTHKTCMGFQRVVMLDGAVVRHEELCEVLAAKAKERMVDRLVMFTKMCKLSLPPNENVRME